MAVLSSYRTVLAAPGAALFSATGLVGRLPISMASLGIVLLVEAGTGSYGVAGSVAGAYTVANAVLAVVLGRLVDRLGQGRVLAALGVAFGVTVALLIVSVAEDWARPVTYVAAALAGATLPPVGSCVRARWAHALGGSGQPVGESGPRLQTAYALEAVVDEMVFMTGPILVTVLATLVDPVLGLAAAGAAGAVGSLAFAAQRRTEPPVVPHHDDSGVRAPMPWRTVVPVVGVTAGLGVLFGAAEVTTVAFADEQGHKGWSGALLAVWALGSLLAGLVTGAIAWQRGPSYRLRIGAFGMAVAMAPLFLVGSIPLMGVLLLVGGVAIAPTMIAATSLVQQVVPASRLTEGMAWIQTGVVVGIAPGAALSGAVVDAAGASPAYLVSLGAGLLAAAAALAIPRQPGQAGPRDVVPSSQEVVA
ncbi:MFS transporter [Nocardioides flavescens]|uniref:MFS transporter n=1 Tax=Nocardioides flavescens TaxID=2691959 RepID=A0A6L7EWK3_9ACTN|nr:MFS transporter [Nocardioides flavescens]MXG88585.1 MFS transporter [Nocardioides flavescens]